MNRNIATIVATVGSAAVLTAGGIGGALPSFAGHASPHRAATGTMSFAEWYDGVAEGMPQADVEGNGPGGCTCTGTVTRTWTGTSGALRKEVTYQTDGSFTAIVSYRLTNGVWTTYDYKDLGVVSGTEFNAYQFHYDYNGVVR